MMHDEYLRQEAERRLDAGVHSGRQPEPKVAPSAPGLRADTSNLEEQLQQRLQIQEHELHVHQIELEIQNEELRRANVQLEQAHDRYADLFEFAPVGYVLLDRGGVIQQINATGARQLGALRPQLLGRRLSLFIGDGQRAAFAALLDKVFAADSAARPDPSTALPVGGEGAGAQHRAEFQMIRPDGAAWDVQLECGTLPGSGVPVARAVLTDVTALKGAQRELEQLNRTLEEQVAQRTAQTRQLHEEIQTFVYSITHDMTRPLRQIQGFSDLLTQHAGALDERRTRYLAHVTQAARHMGSQMASLLAFFQSSQPLDHRQQVDLNTVMEAVRRDLEPEMQDRQVELSWAPLPTLEADLLSLQAVFGNLLSNAVKFTRPREQAVIRVEVQDHGDTYLFSVRDNGVGFESRQGGRLFGVFQRLHSEREFEGQGMGLALVRRIVQRYQGRVWAESVPQQGSVFWVELPKAPRLALDDTASW